MQSNKIKPVKCVYRPRASQLYDDLLITIFIVL